MLGGVAALGTAITGIGLIIVGPAVAFAAAGSLLGGLVGAGVPSEEAKRLQDEVNRGMALVAVHPVDEGQAREVEKLIANLKADRIDLAHA
jgi:hypothetical protein